MFSHPATEASLVHRETRTGWNILSANLNTFDAAKHTRSKIYGALRNYGALARRLTSTVFLVLVLSRFFFICVCVCVCVYQWEKGRGWRGFRYKQVQCTAKAIFTELWLKCVRKKTLINIFSK